MKDNSLYKLQNQLFFEWSDYLLHFPWEWHVTLTFDNKLFNERWYRIGTLRPLSLGKINYPYARVLYRRWQFKLIDRERLQIGACCLSSYKNGRIHLHILMLGRNREGKTLKNCSRKCWEKIWPYFARINTVQDCLTATNYVAKHFLGFRSDHANVEFYNTSLLKRVMIPQYDISDLINGLESDEKE